MCSSYSKKNIPFSFLLCPNNSTSSTSQQQTKYLGLLLLLLLFWSLIQETNKRYINDTDDDDAWENIANLTLTLANLDQASNWMNFDSFKLCSSKQLFRGQQKQQQQQQREILLLLVVCHRFRLMMIMMIMMLKRDTNSLNFARQIYLFLCFVSEWAGNVIFSVAMLYLFASKLTIVTIAMSHSNDNFLARYFWSPIAAKERSTRENSLIEKLNVALVKLWAGIILFSCDLQLKLLLQTASIGMLLYVLAFNRLVGAICQLKLPRKMRRPLARKRPRATLGARAQSAHKQRALTCLFLSTRIQFQCRH